MADAAKASGPKKGYKEAEQHEKAYQSQKGVFVFGKPGSRKEGSRRAKHVSDQGVSRLSVCICVWVCTEEERGRGRGRGPGGWRRREGWACGLG